MKHFFYVDHFLHDFGLPDIPRNPVKDERIDVRFKLVRLHGRVDRRSPQLDGDFVRHELAFARVFKEGFADFRAGVDRAEYIAAGAVIKARDRPQRFALRPFAAAGRAKEDKSIISHRRKSVYTAGDSEPEAESASYFAAARGSTFTRRPARSKRTFPSMS